jgi:hypothetical protein
MDLLPQNGSAGSRERITSKKMPSTKNTFDSNITIKILTLSMKTKFLKDFSLG